jgi:hypothetical protein
MDPILTLAEIEARFVAEWILVGDPKTDPVLGVQGGTVLAHSKDRDEVYREVVKRRPADFAILYTGEMPEDTAIVL